MPFGTLRIAKPLPHIKKKEKNKLDIMKARTQYNDFVGTAAADISDHSNLTDFSNRRGVDTERYEPIGASFYHGYANFFSGSIICIDRQQSNENEPYIVKIHFEAEFTHEEFFNLFKRFNAVVTKKYGGHHDREIDEEITIDDREQLEE